MSKKSPRLDGDEAPDARARILLATETLIANGGREAATTRAIATAAAVQAPAIYRIFGDKRGLLDAVVQHSLAAYVADKASREPAADPVQALRDGWDTHVAFGLAHPGLFAIMSSSPDLGGETVDAGYDVLRRKVNAVARVGRLQVSEARAVALMQAACVGTVLTLLGEPKNRRDSGLSEAAREAVLAAITSKPSTRTVHSARKAAIALRANLGETTVLSAGEQHLLTELLERISNGPS